MEWLARNCEWVFSGIGVALLGGLWGLIRYKRKAGKGTVLQKSGSNSVNINAGRDVYYGTPRKK
jgi:hypothetical protein|nr:MAG TPA: hypothetical protein [Caudoviricetes sp.]